MTSPMQRNSRTTLSASMKRPQNKEAAQRLAQVMAQQPADDEEEEDDLYDFDSEIPSAGIGLAGGRQPRTLRKASATATAEQPQPSSARHRPALSKPVDQSPPTASATVDQQPSSARHRQTHSALPVEEAQQPQSARSSASGRSSSTIEQPSSARLVGRPNLRVKTVAMVPSSVSLSLKPVVPGNQADSQLDKARDKKLSLDFGTFKHKEPSGQQSSSALQDELDMLQEENESLLEKLRIAEERYDEAEARTRQLEKQVESLGEGVSLEAQLLSRKEADLQKREVALKVASKTYGAGNEELAVLRLEVEAAKEEASCNLDQLHGVEHEVKSLRILTQRMILSREEMEEVVLKRCWLARCWSLCVRHGIHADIAEARHEYWSQFASRPVDVILAAGRKAKEADSSSLEERQRDLCEKDETAKKPDVESMFLVEKGLNELSLLKVQDAIAISMAKKRRSNIIKPNMDELKLPAESNSNSDAFGLSSEECEDVLLKQAWLSYIWRRAKNEGLAGDIAEERLQFWLNQRNSKPNSHDAVDVVRGFVELRKLGIEAKLWEQSRRLPDPHSIHKALLETEYRILS